jgi:zinc protease
MRVAWWLVFGLCSVAAPALATDDAILLDIPHELFTLDNGLTVILHEDHDAPVVSVNVSYLVGSADNGVGSHHFAHLFEHLMFRGSQHTERGYLQDIELMGGTANGTTFDDSTVYTATVPSAHLERLLWLEADRMGYLRGGLDQTDLDAEREVVRSEGRQRVRDQPFGGVGLVALDNLYPEGHPYDTARDGAYGELNAASLEAVAAFYEANYGPRSALLTIAGDIDIPQVRAWIDTWFGVLPSRGRGHPEDPGPVEVVERLDETLILPVPESRVLVTWLTPAWLAPDDAELDMLSAVLDNGYAPRLSDMVHRRNVRATTVTAGQTSKKWGGRYSIGISFPAGKDVEPVLEALWEIIDELGDETVSDEEFSTALRHWKLRELNRAEGPEAIAARLSSYWRHRGETESIGDSWRRFEELEPEDLRRVAERWLGRERASVVIVEADADASPLSFPGLDVEDSADNAALHVLDDGQISAGPPLGEPESVSLPTIERFSHRSGLDVILLPDHDVPTLAQMLVFQGGALVEPLELRGLSSTTAWSMLGGARRDKNRSITRQVHGRTLGLSAINGEGYTGLRFQARSANYGALMQAFTEVVIRPALSESAVANIVRQKYATLQRNRSVPRFRAWELFRRALFGGHPAEVGPIGWLKSVPRIDGRAARAYHRAWWLPRNGSLLVAGDVTQRDLSQILDDALKGWRKKRPRQRRRTAPVPRGGRIVLIDQPGLSQSQLYVGSLGPSAGDEDLAAVEVLSQVLGGGLGARLNRRLRLERQITYGAGSALLVLPETGALFAWTSVDGEATAECVREILSIFEQVRVSAPPDAAEVQRAVIGLEGRLLRAFMTNEESAAALLELLQWGQDPTDPAAWIDKLRAVGPAEVVAVAQRLLRPDALTFVVLGDAAALEEELTGLGLDVQVLHGDR